MSWKAQAGRKRSVHLHLWATEEEAALIKERMETTGISSFGAYARKMLIDGYHVNVDLTDVRHMVRLLKNASDNINQVARRANEARSVRAADVEALREQFCSLWEAANGILTELARIR
jgi:hypothetical protein